MQKTRTLALNFNTVVSVILTAIFLKTGEYIKFMHIGFVSNISYAAIYCMYKFFVRCRIFQINA